MALVSPGIEISVTDESQYLPTAVGTVPFIVVATAQDKTINGLVAPGTTKANAGKIYGITSQRELAVTFGTPTFRQTAAGTPLHGDELNEYGLMAAYSALGLGNRAWIVRADIDLDDLVGTTSRPLGTPPNGRGWFDYSVSRFGIYEFDSSIAAPDSPFTEKTPLIITANVNTPASNIGSIGDYAVIVSKSNNPVFKKVVNLDSTITWEAVGSTNWSQTVPVVTSTLTTESANLAANIITPSTPFYINGTAITPASNITTMSGIATLLNSSSATTGVQANVDAITGQLKLFISNVSMTSANLFNEANANVSITTGAFGSIGITAGNYRKAALNYGSYTEVPAWRRTDSVPRPSGSVWAKTSSEGQGVNLVFKRYNATTGVWSTLTSKVYADGYAALVALDPVGGGGAIPVNSLWVKQDANKDGTLTYRAYYQKAAGQTKVTGDVASPTLVNGAQFTITASRPGLATPVTSGTLTVNGTDVNAFVAAVVSANLPNVTAYVENNRAVVVHRSGGIIVLTNGTNTPVTAAGFTSATAGVDSYIVSGSVALTNFAPWDYAVSDSQPFTNPADGRLWYYNDPLAVDILISDSTGWKGYRNVNADARGYNLTLTDPNGVIISPTAPDYQSAGEGSPLRSGDLWLDSSDLENYPKLYRYDSATTTWNLVDNTDRITQNGIVFADARWDYTGTTDPVTGTLPSIKDMLTQNYTDIDAPDYRLFPRGTLLFNTRRSGFTVKKFVVNYFNTTAFPGQTIPTKTSTWVSQIGFKSTGQPSMGHYAQRNEIVAAMKAALDANLNLREEGYAFNLLAAPGYPELIPNLVLLNNDRSNTAFVIGDTPMNLASSITAIAAHSQSAPTASPYLGLYYPSALTTDLNGNEIAVPASHMMLRTFLYNDNVSYQWFAPAGTRRGLVDNALAIGYVSSSSGTFVRTGINNQLRDSLYDNLINPITLINGVGIVAYGQKTRGPTSSSTGGAVTSGTALDRINVSRMVNYLRTVLSGVANQFLFEPNDKITRDQIKTLIDSVMNDLIAKRGIYDYLVVCDETNNTPDRIARNELYVDIAVEPMKSVEFIYIPIRLKNPGTISGAATTA